jgi:STAS-like domain of unknown function (DUF4325)
VTVVVGAGPTFAFAQFCTLLNRLTPALDDDTRIVIDLSKPYFFTPSGMVPLLAMVADLADNGRSIDVVYPEDEWLQQYFDSAGWTAAIEGRSSPAPFARTTYTPLASFGDHTTLNREIDLVLDVLAKVSEFGKGALSAIEWSLNEIADNVLVHAAAARGWLQVIARPDNHLVDIVVADRGPGIRATLRESYSDLASDQDALRLAIQAGVTRNKAIGQGNGLAGSFRITQATRGWMNLVSGTGNLRLFNDGAIKDLGIESYQGTIVTLTLPTNADVDLAEALWGHPPSGVFEHSHLHDEGIIFQVRDESTGFGNRGSGHELATKLRNIHVQFPTEKVIINFEGIDLATASFLDEFIAKTIKAAGVATFFTDFRLVGMNELVKRTVDTVIAQRLAAPD